MRNYQKPVKIALIKKTKDKCWQGWGEKGTLVHAQWECKIGTVIREKNYGQFSEN